MSVSKRAAQLTEAVRRRPYCVVLFDEIEKAHQDVFNIMLQILDDGCLTDAQGRTVDFNNALLIMASNIGSQRILGYRGAFAGSEYDHMKDAVWEEVRHFFKPEFLNRVDEIIVFHALSEEHLMQIAEIQLKRVRARPPGSDRIRPELRRPALESGDPEEHRNPAWPVAPRWNHTDGQIVRIDYDRSSDKMTFTPQAGRRHSHSQFLIHRLAGLVDNLESIFYFLNPGGIEGNALRFGFVDPRPNGSFEHHLGSSHLDVNAVASVLGQLCESFLNSCFRQAPIDRAIGSSGVHIVSGGHDIWFRKLRHTGNAVLSVSVLQQHVRHAVTNKSADRSSKRRSLRNVQPETVKQERSAQAEYALTNSHASPFEEQLLLCRQHVNRAHTIRDAVREPCDPRLNVL